MFIVKIIEDILAVALISFDILQNILIVPLNAVTVSYLLTQAE